MKYYRTIEDLPIWNFNKVSETNDVRYLLKLDDYYTLPKKAPYEELIKIYEDIYTEVFEKFKFNDSLDDKVREDKDLLILQLKILAGEKHLNTILKIKKRQIKDRLDMVKVEPQTFEKKVVILESYFKLPFDVYKMSTVRFYTYLQLYKEAAKVK